MKKIILLLITLIIPTFAISKKDLIGQYICKGTLTNKNMFGKTILNIIRELNISENKISINENIKIEICPKKFFIIGSYICIPQYKGFIKITGKYHLKDNKLILKANERKTIIEDDLKYKKEIEHKKGYDNCSEQGKLSKICYKAKNIFEKQWKNKSKQIQNYKKEDIILIYEDKENPFYFKDKSYKIEFECDIKE